MLFHLLNQFALEHLRIIVPKRFVTSLPIPDGYDLVHQDQTKPVFYKKRSYDKELVYGVLCDIFYNATRYNYALNVRFMNENDEVSYRSYTNISLPQVFDLITEYDGNGEWQTACGRLWRLLFKNNFHHKFQTTKNVRKLNKCVNRFSTKNARYCQKDDCFAMVSKKFCFFHTLQYQTSF